MKSKTILLVLSTILLFSGCKKDEEGQPTPTGIVLSNTGAEQGSGGMPDDWWFRNGPYQVGWTSEEAFEGDNSIKITSDSSDDDDFGFWAISSTEGIEEGRRLRLQVSVKTVGVEGEGASIVIRGDDTTTPQGSAELFISTQGDIYIGGTSDWKDYSVDLEDFISPTIQSITVYLVLLPNTSGTVYFDNIRLTYI